MTDDFQIGYPHRDTKPILFIEAGIHAREWIAPAMALYIIKEARLFYIASHETVKEVAD